MSVDLTREQSDAILTECRGRYDVASDVWGPIRANGKKNMLYVAGDPWEAADRKAREAAGRPCISLDEISQYTNQVINQLRAKRRGVQFTANGNGANDQTAEFYQNKMREIEYRSKAQIVYTTAAQNSIERGYGFCRVKTQFQPGKSFDQEIWLEEFVNPDSVLPDPDAKRSTSSDMKYCFVHEAWKVPEFKRAFPQAKVTSFEAADTINLAPAWIHGDDLVLAEYWTITTHQRELALLRGPDGRTIPMYAEDVPAEFAQYVVKRRMVDDPKVCSYLTNGVELLAPSEGASPKTEWPGKYIPIISCFGKVIYVDTGSGVERKIQGMVDLMRDPQMLNAYLRTCEAELVGMTPKTPFVGYTGQFRGHEDAWGSVNHVPKAYLEANATTPDTGQQVLPLPQRQAYDPPIQSLEILAESSRRSIQAAAGNMPLPTSAQRRNEKSGVALKEMRESGQVGSYHFGDHYNDMIEHVGVVVEDLMPHIYDTARDVSVRHANDTAEMVPVNDPSNEKSVSTTGDHLVTVSTGPSYDSTREQISDLVDTLLAMPDGEVVRSVLPEAIKMMNLGAEGEELVEIAEALQPPQVQALKQKDGEDPDPRQLQQQNQQMQQQLQQADAAVTDLMGKVDGKKLDAETKIKITEMEIASRERIADMESQRRSATAIAVAHIGAAAKGLALDAHADEEAQAMGLAEREQARTHAHDATQAELDRQQAQQLAQQQADQQVALTGAQLDTQGAQADAQRVHETEMADRAAAAEPEPDA